MNELVRRKGTATNEQEYIEEEDSNTLQSIPQFITVTEDGDDRGLALTDGQFSCDGEIIAGNDSYPVPLAFHCDTANTTGKVITGAIDVTTILQSDSLSSTGLFGGTSSGKYVLVGSPLINEGAKIKYNSLATVEPENIQGQFYLDDTDGWVDSSMMVTNSNTPHEATGWNLAVDNHTSEQIFFGFDPLTRDESEQWQLSTFNINGVDYEMYFSRLIITDSITGDPQVQQVKLHRSRIEIEDTGIFKYQRARSPMPLPFTLIKNDLSDPINEAVDYTPQYSADFIDNELANGAKDGFGLIINRVFGLDTSVPVTIGLSFYVKGITTGDIELNYEVSQVTDGYVYDATEPYDSYSIIKTIDTDQNLTRFSVKLLAEIYQLQSNSAIVVNVYRDATVSNTNDTLASNIVRTNVDVIGYRWKV